VPDPEPHPAGAITVDHLAVLGRAITSDVALAGGVYTATAVEDLPTEFREWPGHRGVPGLVFPWCGITGKTAHQLRPDKPVEKGDGEFAKYVFAKGTVMMLNVHPMMADAVADKSKPLLIVEGTKQYLAAVTALVGKGEYAAVGMAGCYGWSQQGRQLDDLRVLKLNGRDVVLALDADFATNRGVWDAASKLTEWVRDIHGAKTVKYVSVPGGGTTGLDDALAEADDIPAAMERLIEAAKPRLPKRPPKGNVHEFFDDDNSLLAEQAAIALLEAKPCALAADGSVAVYQDGRYQIDQHALTAAVTDLLGDRFRIVHRATIVELIAGRLHTLNLRLGDRPKSPLLNVRNGMLDLETLELHPHDPSYLSTAQLPVDWDPEATCPTYDAWLPTVLRADQIEDLEEVTSLMLDPHRIPSKSVFLFGPSRSGKSTFLRIMRSVMGDEATSAVTLHQLSDDRFAAANLYGKKLNVAADLSNKHVEDLSTWKMLTGEDVVTHNKKHGSQFPFVNQALFAFAANEPPTVAESSRAYFARIKPFHFPNTFAGNEDPALEDTMRDHELSGILRRWVEAHRRYRARWGQFRPTAPDVAGQFEAASDRVQLWLAEEMTIVREYTDGRGSKRAVSEGSRLPLSAGTTKTVLYDRFREWASDNGYRPLGKRRFAERLTCSNAVVEIKFTKTGSRGLNIISRSEEDREGQSGQFDEHYPHGAGENEGSGNSETHGSSGFETAPIAPLSSDPAQEPGSEPTPPADTQCDHAEVLDLGLGELPVVRLDVDDLTGWVYDAIAADPGKATTTSVREALKISETEFKAARDYLAAHGVLAKRPGKGFDHLATLVAEPTPYVPMTDPVFVNDADGSPSLGELLRVAPRSCPICGAETDDPTSYFPFCPTHRVEAS